MSNPESTYDQVKRRLEEIAREVGDQDLSLDAALDLYEEAVKLGMNASQLIESETFAVPDQAQSEDDPAGTASPHQAASAE